MVDYNHGGLVMYKNPLCQIMHTMGFSLIWSKEYVKRYALILKLSPLFNFFWLEPCIGNLRLCALIFVLRRV